MTFAGTTTGAAIDSREPRPPCGCRGAAGCRPRCSGRRTFRDGARRAPGFAEAGQLPRAVTGTVLDVSPHVLLHRERRQRDQRLTLTADATAWRGGPLDPAAGSSRAISAVVRLHRTRRGVADRIWANIGRVTGTIVDRDRRQPARGRGPDHAAPGRDRSRGARPGGSRSASRPWSPVTWSTSSGCGGPARWRRRIPATSQPAYPADQVPAPPLVSRPRAATRISGSATWHEPPRNRPGCSAWPTRRSTRRPAAPRTRAGGPRPGYARHALPRDRQPAAGPQRLHRLRPACSRSPAAPPWPGCSTTGASPAAPRPRGRVADLTMASFVALGGELERGLLQRDDHDRPLTCWPVRSRDPGGADPAAVRHAPRRLRGQADPDRCGSARWTPGSARRRCSRCGCGARSRWRCARSSSACGIGLIVTGGAFGRGAPGERRAVRLTGPAVPGGDLRAARTAGQPSRTSAAAASATSAGPPVSGRTLARAALLAVAALATIGLPPLHLPRPGRRQSG